jgi:hypothetical protein
MYVSTHGLITAIHSGPAPLEIPLFLQAIAAKHFNCKSSGVIKHSTVPLIICFASSKVSLYYC